MKTVSVLTLEVRNPGTPRAAHAVWVDPRAACGVDQRRAQDRRVVGALWRQRRHHRVGSVAYAEERTESLLDGGRPAVKVVVDALDRHRVPPADRGLERPGESWVELGLPRHRAQRLEPPGEALLQVGPGVGGDNPVALDVGGGDRIAEPLATEPARGVVPDRDERVVPVGGRLAVPVEEDAREIVIGQLLADDAAAESVDDDHRVARDHEGSTDSGRVAQQALEHHRRAHTEVEVDQVGSCRPGERNQVTGVRACRAPADVGLVEVAQAQIRVLSESAGREHDAAPRSDPAGSALLLDDGACDAPTLIQDDLDDTGLHFNRHLRPTAGLGEPRDDNLPAPRTALALRREQDPAGRGGVLGEVRVVVGEVSRVAELEGPDLLVGLGRLGRVVVEGSDARVLPVGQAQRGGSGIVETGPGEPGHVP